MAGDQHRLTAKSGGKKSAAPLTATSRLRNDYMRLKKDPVPYIVAEPNPSNILEWHYVVSGPPDTPYEGGFYHGKVNKVKMTNDDPESGFFSTKQFSQFFSLNECCQ